MKILLADDHALIRSGLRSELATLAENIEFLDASDAPSLRRLLAEHRDIDLALVDLTMPGMDGARTIGELRQAYPVIPLVVVSGVDDTAQMQAVLRAGAAGFIPKTSVGQLVLPAIRLVLAGGQYLPPQLMLAPASDAGLSSAQPAAMPVPPAANRMDALSPRQREVFRLLAQGLSNKMIARQLAISEGTVKSHVATIFDVLRVHNRVSAVAEARLSFAESVPERKG